MYLSESALCLRMDDLVSYPKDLLIRHCPSSVIFLKPVKSWESRGLEWREIRE